jgi:Zn-dependent protease with chaperone function
MQDKEHDGVNDLYVKGEDRQGFMFYLFVALLVAFALILLIMVYDYLETSFSIDTVWSAVSFVLSLAIGAVAGVIAFTAFSRFKYLQIMVRNSLKVSPHSFPEVFAAVKLAADRLSMKPVDTYVTQNPMVNAFMVKLGLIRRKKVIVLNTGLVQTMEGNELLFIIGHELSHVKYGRWRRSKWLGLPFLLSSQFAEYRCDRGGLVASGNVEASVKALLKLVTGKEFIDKVDVKSFGKEDTPDGVLLRLSTHPMIDARIKELMRFYDSAAFKKI